MNGAINSCLHCETSDSSLCVDCDPKIWAAVRFTRSMAAMLGTSVDLVIGAMISTDSTEAAAAALGVTPLDFHAAFMGDCSEGDAA